MKSPTASEVIEAIEKWARVAGVSVVVDRGARTRGRAWSYGIRGVVEHHWAGVGDGGLEWMAARDGSYPFCNAAIRRDGTIVILSALSAWGSGTGGPWPAAGVPKDQGHLYLWQNEFESWGREPDFTRAMWAAAAAIDCALREVAGPEAFPDFTRLINHKGWTDGGPEMGLDYYLPTRWRKNDTVYNISEFRTRAQTLWDANVAKPVVTVSLRKAQPGKRNRHVKVVKRALLAEGLYRGTVGFTNWFGPRVVKAYTTWQLKCGVTGIAADGSPDLETLTALGNKHGFKVVS